MFFLGLYRTANEVVDIENLGPSAESQIASYAAELEALAQVVGTQYNAESMVASLEIAINALRDQFGIAPPSQSPELQQQIDILRQDLETLPRPPLGTMAQLQQSWLPWVTFDNAPEVTPPDVGTVAWDGGTTLGVQMTANVLGRVNESGYYYIKASSAITKGEVVMFTGAVGASGVPTGAPATGVTDGSYIMGVAAESLALNDFGLVQFIGTLRGVNTAAYADGDILWYNPAVTGGLTKTKPSAPNVKVQMAAVISATSNGTILIRVSAGSELGGTDSNVQFGTLANGDLIQYDSVAQYWKNVPSSTFGTGSVTTVSVASANGFAGTVANATTTPAITISTSITGLLYGNGTAVAAATVSAPLSYLAGTLSIPVATASANGYLSSTDWSTFNGKQAAYTNLTSIGSLANSAGWLYNNGSGTFSYSTPTKTDVGLGNVTNDAQTKAAIVPNTAPSAGQLLVGNAGGTAYAPVSMSGDATLASTGAITVSKFNGGTAFGSAAGYAASAFQAAGTYVTSVSGTSPVSSSGGTTPAISLASGYGDTQNPYASKTANYVLAAPNGSAGVPTFRALVAADIPSLAYQPTAAPVTYTSNFSVATTDVWIINNKSGSSCTVTLPTASSNTGRVLYFLNYQAQTLVSASSNVVPLTGGAAGTAILAAVAGDTATLVSDGTNWIMTQYTPNNVLLLE